MNSRKSLLIVLVIAAALPPVTAQSPKSNGQGNSDSSSTGGPGSSEGNNGNAGGASAAAPRRASASFELPRLKTRRNPHDTAAMPKEHATVHELSSNGKATAHAHTSQGVSYVAIEAGTSWSSIVRGAAKDTTFVSFFAYASEGTSIEIAGAKLLIKAASKPGYAQIKIGRPTAKGVQWRDFGGPVKLESYGGASLAALPVLTARLDGAAGVWDLFVGGRLGVVDLPLGTLPRGAPRHFVVHAGAQGARVCGLISSDDNPLYEDENRNAIEDLFEQQQNRGKLLESRDGGTARAQLAGLWQRDQQSRPSAPWAVRRPLPDGLPERPAGK